MQVELAALSSNSQHIIAEKSGHSIALQQPELVVEVIRQLVNGVSVNIQDSTLPIATATLGMSTPLSSQDAARFTQSEFTLLTQFSAGRIFYVGVGGDIDGVVNPALVVPPGTIARVIVVNGDGIAHDLILPDFGVHSAIIDRKGQTTEVMFTVNEDQAGNYPYFCSKPGHRESGQEGRLLVPIKLKNDPG